MKRGNTDIKLKLNVAGFENPVQYVVQYYAPLVFLHFPSLVHPKKIMRT